MVKQLKISLINLDGGTQTRSGLDQETISSYSAEMSNGIVFPDIVVFYDGSKYWIADGFHRIKAAMQADIETINAEIKQGTRRDAILYSAGANNAHGLRRTNADKRRAVQMLLEDDEWSKWPDMEIARRCGVSHTFVQNMRPVSCNGCKIKTVERNGTTYKQNTSNIGRRSAEDIKSKKGGTHENISVFPTGQPAEQENDKVELLYYETIKYIMSKVESFDSMSELKLYMKKITDKIISLNQNLLQ